MTEPLLHTSEISAFADLWYETQAACDQPLLAKEDMPLRKLAPFMPNLTLISFDHDDRAKFHLCGTGVAASLGADLTGGYLDDGMDAEAIEQSKLGILRFREEYGPDARRAYWSRGSALGATGREVHYEDLSLPYLVRETGEMRMLCYIAVLNIQGFSEQQMKRHPTRQSIWFNALDARPEWLYQRQTETA